MGRIISPRFFVVQGSGYAHFVVVDAHIDPRLDENRSGRPMAVPAKRQKF